MSVRRLIPVEAGDPLLTTRRLLENVWNHSNLLGLFLPIWFQDDQPPKPMLIKATEQLKDADPFAPVMIENAATSVLKTMQANPEARIGFLLRPCELRSLDALLQIHSAALGESLLISTDCLATFPIEDFDWRLDEAGDREKMSRTALHFAAQGGVLPSRYRDCCQICYQPYCETVDVYLELFGYSTRDILVIAIEQDELAEELCIDEYADQPVHEEITERRKRIITRIKGWRQQALDYSSAHLREDQKTIEALLQHILTCTKCARVISDHCPIIDVEMLRSNGGEALSSLKSWLHSCGGCGMCDYHCPQGYPLFKTITYLSMTK